MQAFYATCISVELPYSCSLRFQRSDCIYELAHSDMLINPCFPLFSRHFSNPFNSSVITSHPQSQIRTKPWADLSAMLSQEPRQWLAFLHLLHISISTHSSRLRRLCRSVFELSAFQLLSFQLPSFSTPLLPVFPLLAFSRVTLSCQSSHQRLVLHLFNFIFSHHLQSSSPQSPATHLCILAASPAHHVLLWTILSMLQHKVSSLQALSHLFTPGIPAPAAFLNLPAGI